MSFAADQALLHYVLVRRLGEGGMGEVWLARDTRLDRLVALKFLTGAAARIPEARARLLREARAASALSHPHILTIYAVESADGQDFISMEYAEGVTLDEWSRGERDARGRLELMRGVAAGLAAAHARGIVHRDVKPGNIMVRADGRPQIMDFGLAKRAEDAQLTQAGSTVGTLAYMAPEQVRGRDVDARADQFSFGVVLFELLSGTSPFAREDVAAVLHAILHEEPPPLELEGEEGRIARDVLARALAKDPARRFTDMDQVVALLSGGASGAPAVRKARTWRTAAVVLPLLLLAVLLGGFLGGLFGGADRPGAEPVPAYTQQLLPLGAGAHSPTLAPDGSRLAFLSEVDGADQVFVSGVSEGSPRRLTNGPRAAHRPRWSPVDNRVLYYVSREGDQQWKLDGDVYTVSALGGEPVLLFEHGVDPTWSSDGARIVFERSGRVWICDADGGGAERLEYVPPVANVLVGQTPALSPDGTQLVVFRSELGPLGRLWLVDLEREESRVLCDDLDIARDPSFSPDGRWVVYSSVRAGARTLWRVSTETTGPAVPQAITTGAGEDSEPSLSADGRRIAFTNSRNDFVVKAWNPETEEEPRVVLSSRSPVLAPAWSPDGERFAVFGRGSEPGSHVVEYTREGGGPRQVTRGPTEVAIFPLWSADGGSLYYFQELGEGAGYHRVPAAGGVSEVLAPGWTMQTHPFPARGPDGKVVVSEFRADQPPRTLLLDVETGEQEALPVTVFRGTYSPDGTRLVGEWPMGAMVLHGPMDGGPEDRGLVRLGPGQAARFSPDGERIYFLLAQEDRWELYSCDTTGGDRRRLADLGHMFHQAAVYDVSSNGELIWTEYREGDRELWVLDER